MRSAPATPDSIAAQTLAAPFNFFSSGIRQKVDQLMDILYAGGVNNPMDSIEQLSYLLFLRLLTEKDEVLASLDRKYTRSFSGKWARFAWGNFVTLAGDQLFNAVRDAIESLHELPGLTDTGKLLFSRATELLFLKWFIDHLTPNGRAGVIVPNGVLFGATKAATAVRQLLLTECDLQAVISLPSGVFKPYSGVGTAALVFQKGKPTESVWFYDLTADGFSLDDKRTPIDANDIPDVLVKWPKREEGPNSYRVPIEQIRENDWSLAAGRYKPVTTEAANHDAPADILGDVLKLENEIIRRGNVLLAQLGGEQ